MINTAPIVLFVYNRPSHTRRTVEALLANYLAAWSDLIVFADGPKNDAGEQAVNEVRAYIRSISGFKSVNIIESDENLGLAESIIRGVTRVCSQYGRVIVLEDDLVTSIHFLQYMNEALELYKNDDSVISVHGYIYPMAATLPETFFLRGADCWGWATWKRGWDLFERNGEKLLGQLNDPATRADFNFDESYDYFSMLRSQIEKRNDSWAIRWYASAFLLGKLTLYPGKSLVMNIGNDNSGTHCVKTDIFAVQLADNPLRLTRVLIEEDSRARLEVTKYFRSINGSFFHRMKAYICAFLEKYSRH